MGEDVCIHHEKLASNVEDIKECVHRTDDRLAKGDVNFGKIGIRLAIIEKIVYGGVALVLIGVAGAVIHLVVNGG